jgi:hypothetical protein
MVYAAIGFFCNYCAEKYALLRLWRRLAPSDGRLATLSAKMISVGVLLHISFVARWVIAWPFDEVCSNYNATGSKAQAQYLAAVQQQAMAEEAEFTTAQRLAKPPPATVLYQCDKSAPVGYPFLLEAFSGTDAEQLQFQAMLEDRYQWVPPLARYTAFSLRMLCMLLLGGSLFKFYAGVRAKVSGDKERQAALQKEHGHGTSAKMLLGSARSLGRSVRGMSSRLLGRPPPSEELLHAQASARAMSARSKSAKRKRKKKEKAGAVNPPFTDAHGMLGCVQRVPLRRYAALRRAP